MKQKIYCYADETGQDTKGSLFIVGVVLTHTNRDELITVCEAIEAASGKNRAKWIRSKPERRYAYIRQVLKETRLQGKLYVRIGHDVKDYASFTNETIAWAVRTVARESYKVTVLYDGLPRSQERQVGSKLRRLGIQTKTVRGVREETDALSRLADALCGFAREAVEGQEQLKLLYTESKREGYLLDNAGQ